MRTHARIVIAHHLILSSYGFWLANDPRGSGSDTIRQPKFEELGPIHHGRKRLQPTREELRAFYQAATPRLDFAPLWFDQQVRDLLTNSIGETVRKNRYTVWACAIVRNHVHLCVRRHRDTYQVMWDKLTERSRDEASTAGVIPAGHPLWAHRPYSVYLYDREDVLRTIAYIEQNPLKDGLSPQRQAFITPYS
jgi:REP element-mobilizing transposase RayT